MHVAVRDPYTKAMQHQYPKVLHQEDLMEVQFLRQCISTGANGCAPGKPPDGQMGKKISFNFNFLWSLSPYIYTPIWFILLEGECVRNVPLQPHAYLVILFALVYIVFLLRTTIHIECTQLFNNRKGFLFILVQK
jgi:hypothetical protein